MNNTISTISDIMASIGTSVEFKAFPDYGWQVKERKVDGVSQGINTPTLTVTENHIVTIEFEQKGNGGGSSEPPQQ